VRWRPGFAEGLASRARVDGLALSATIEFAYRVRYNLPPTDPRFLDATIEQMAVDFWAWRHWEDPKLRDELVVADGYEDDAAEMEAEALAKETEHQAKIAAVPPEDWEDV
jgi:hypothetical protein